MAWTKGDSKGVVEAAIQASEHHLRREIRAAMQKQTRALEKKIDAAVDEVCSVIIDTSLLNEELYPKREEFGELKARVERFEHLPQPEEK